MLKEFLNGGKYFVMGALCFMIANVPNIYGALINQEFAPMGFLCLIQLGLSFYLADSLTEARPKAFVVVGSINWSLNLVVILLALIS